MKRVVVLDYGSGNLRSAQRALERVGAEVAVTSDAGAAIEADGLVVPGVGAFAACMAGLAAVHGGAAIVERARRGRPVLGICVGMQVLFDGEWSTAKRRQAWACYPAGWSRCTHQCCRTWGGTQ